MESFDNRFTSQVDFKGYGRFCIKFPPSRMKGERQARHVAEPQVIGLHKFCSCPCEQVLVNRILNADCWHHNQVNIDLIYCNFTCFLKCKNGCCTAF